MALDMCGDRLSLGRPHGTNPQHRGSTKCSHTVSSHCHRIKKSQPARLATPPRPAARHIRSLRRGPCPTAEFTARVRHASVCSPNTLRRSTASAPVPAPKPSVACSVLPPKHAHTSPSRLLMLLARLTMLHLARCSAPCRLDTSSTPSSLRAAVVLSLERVGMVWDDAGCAHDVSQEEDGPRG